MQHAPNRNQAPLFSPIFSGKTEGESAPGRGAKGVRTAGSAAEVGDDLSVSLRLTAPLEGEPFLRKKVTSIWISKAPSIDSNCSTATSYKFGTPVSGGAHQDIRKVTNEWNDA